MSIRMTPVEIRKINLGQRVRKELGDVTGLAASIQELGLLQPVVLQPDFTLIAGARRIAAAETLRWTKIPAFIISDLTKAAELLKAERDENTQRKDFATSEAVALGDKLEALERPKAAERKQAGRKSGGRGKKKKLSPKLGESNRKDNETGVRVTKAVGMSHATYRKAKEVVAKAPSLIFTDPPYDRESEPLFESLGKFAAEKLADGGSLLCYVGHIQLKAALDALSKHLRFWWICACVHADSKALLREYGIRAGWKPILWFVKGTRHDKTQIVCDTVSGAREKGHHDWQQAQSEAAYWIEHLCPKDGIVCDPFLGGGTTAAAAQLLKRNWIGFEKDAASAAAASVRVQ